MDWGFSNSDAEIKKTQHETGFKEGLITSFMLNPHWRKGQAQGFIHLESRQNKDIFPKNPEF